jgi:F-type H+-transporting ATPase subunit delta
MAHGQTHPGAMVYARALEEALFSAGGLDALRAADPAVAGVAAAWTDERAFRAYFLSSNVPASVKRAALDRVVEGRLHPLVANFLRLLLRRGRIALLPDIGTAFRTLIDARLGRVPVTLTTAVPVDEVSLRTWTDRIRQAVGGEPVVRHEVRPEILAGAILRVGDEVADGSARRRLAELRSQIIEKGRQHALQS